ncbi:MAG: tetratricopeptide repeat protein [Treponema sp.]|jgi:putative GTP pyrophosphokinase|nr:tetratricopeptide repeat protein [Treponema sp.]
MNNDIFNQDSLLRYYETHADTWRLIAAELESAIEQAVSVLPSRPIVRGRIKSFKSYYEKHLRILKAGVDSAAGPPRITDLMGIRIVCPFIEDLSIVENLLREQFEFVEVERKGGYTFREFGYESTHLLIKIPGVIIEKGGETDCEVAEVQIRTILQDAWAEVEHELVYKAEFTPFDTPMKRKLAAVNASLSLADIIFQEIRTYQRQLNGELGKRRESFYQKIEESTDSLLFTEEHAAKTEIPEAGASKPLSPENASIDDLLLSALYAHNENRFDEAIALYSRILELKPDDAISSLIYKHRGMANFARSHYDDAIGDFSHTLELDAKSYKAAYYRGVVHSVLKQYSEAIDDFTRSLTINPYQSFCLFRRGQSYYHIGDYPQALADCEASLAIESKNETVLKFREMLQLKLKM